MTTNSSKFYGKDTRLGNQTPTIHIHNPNALSFYDAPVVKTSIDRWVSHPFPWQKTVYRDIFAMDEKRKLATSIFCASIPRRNGKTEIIIGTMVVLAVLFSANVLYTAPDIDLAKKTYKRFMTAALDPDSTLRTYFPGLKEMVKAHEHVIEAFDPKTGKRLGSVGFVNRNGKGGRGGTFDSVIIDEAQELTEEQYTRFGPTNAATKKHDRGKKRNAIGITIFFGTPPSAEKEEKGDGVIFRNIRDRSLAEQGLPWESRVRKGTVYMEWGTDKIVDPTNPDHWYEFNPSMGYLDGMEKHFREAVLGPEYFSIEHLGYWTKQSKDRAIEISAFNRLAVPAEGIAQEIAKEGCKMAVAIKSDLKESVVHVGIAWRRKDGSVFYDQIQAFYTNKHGWAEALSKKVIKLVKNPNTVNVTVDGTVATTVITAALIKANLWNPEKSKTSQGKVLMAQYSDIIKSSASLLVSISSKTLQHCGTGPLHKAVEDAKKRKIGERGYGFESISGTVDIVPLEVCALAVYGVDTKAQKRNRSDGSSKTIQEIFRR